MLRRVNKWLNKAAVIITEGVGTMWCAIIFAAIACVSLPGVLKTGDPVQIISWVAQTFLQLVLLSIIMVGQDIQSDATNKTISDTHQAVMDELKALNELTQDLHVHLTGEHYVADHDPLTDPAVKVTAGPALPSTDAQAKAEGYSAVGEHVVPPTKSLS